MTNEQFPLEIQKEIYRPSEGESYYNEVIVDRPAGKLSSVEDDEMSETLEANSDHQIDLGSITTE